MLRLRSVDFDVQGTNGRRTADALPSDGFHCFRFVVLRLFGHGEWNPAEFSRSAGLCSAVPLGRDSARGVGPDTKLDEFHLEASLFMEVFGGPDLTTDLAKSLIQGNVEGSVAKNGPNKLVCSSASRLGRLGKHQGIVALVHQFRISVHGLLRDLMRGGHFWVHNILY